MGTHPIFESDFDCLTDKSNIGLQWPTQWAPPKSSESELRSSTDIKLTDLCVLTNHGENQSVLTPVSEDDSRANILCHLSVMVPRLPTDTDARTKRTSRSSLSTMLLNYKSL